MNWNYDKLKKLDAYARHQLWINAREKAAAGDENASALVELIETSGLDYLRDRQPGVTLDSALGLAMRRIILSPEGQTAALTAHEAGLPPLAGVDPLLKKELGDQYSKRNEATVQAGYIVTGMMQALGYVSTGSAQLPPGCEARTGALFKKEKS